MTNQSLPATDIAGAIDGPLDLQILSRPALLLLIGIALGPQGLAVLTPEVIGVLWPAVAVALAVLGVTAVFGSTGHDGAQGWHRHLPSSLILVAGLTMALRQHAVVEAVAIVGQAACIAALLAAAGWMLSSRGASDDERRVFSVAIFLLLGGVADYLSVSALLVGWIAATAWRRVWGRELSEVRLDAAYVQHPVTAVLLVTAGARVQLSGQIALIAAAACCVALAVMLILRRQRSASDVAFGDLPWPPAAFAVALALDAARLDARLTTLLSIVVLTAAALHLVSGLATEDAA